MESQVSDAMTENNDFSLEFFSTSLKLPTKTLWKTSRLQLRRNNSLNIKIKHYEYHFSKFWTIWNLMRETKKMNLLSSNSVQMKNFRLPPGSKDCTLCFRWKIDINIREFQYWLGFSVITLMCWSQNGIIWKKVCSFWPQKN